MLSVLADLFGALEERGLRYTIWKSLENYAEQLDGDGDVDVLFDDRDRAAVHRLMAEIGFPEDFGTDASVGEDVKVFRGFDGETATHTSIHAYFFCLLGSKTYKEYRFPFESEMLQDSTRVDGVFRADQGHFVTTRLLMVTLRQTFEDTYVCRLAHTFPDLDPHARDIVNRHVRFYFGADPESLLAELAKGEPACLASYREHVHQMMDSQFCIAGRIEQVKRVKSKLSWFQRWVPRLLKFSRNKLATPIGVLLAGHDGTGKTTVSKLLERQLSAVGPSRRIYLGRNDWSSLNASIDRRRLQRRYRFLNWLWPYTSTLEILARLLKGKLRIWLGWIVIYDRSVIDLIYKYDGKSQLGRWFPLWIARVTAGSQADLCYMLTAEPESVVHRKGKHETAEMELVRSRYIALADDRYQVIDTTNTTPQQLASRVIADIFLRASRQGIE